MKNKKSDRYQNKMLILLAVMFIVVFCISAFKVVTILENLKKEENELSELSDFIDESNLKFDVNNNSIAANTQGYEALYQRNPDMAGWIRIDDTKIDYPVMFTPKDPEYYLHRSFNKEHSSSGVPFIGYGSSPESENVMIYGHNMKNGSMFASLLKYADRSFWENHRLIHFDTISEQGSYEIVGAFYSKVYEESEKNVFKYYEYTDLETEDEYEEYIENVKRNALYNTDVDAKYGDRLITLSTCSYHTKDGRFVVVARKLAEE